MRLGIKVNGFMVIFGNVIVDFVRWVLVNRIISGKIEVMFYKFYLVLLWDNFIFKYYYILEIFF